MDGNPHELPAVSVTDRDCAGDGVLRPKMLVLDEPHTSGTLCSRSCDRCRSWTLLRKSTSANTGGVLFHQHDLKDRRRADVA